MLNAAESPQANAETRPLIRQSEIETSISKLAIADLSSILETAETIQNMFAATLEAVKNEVGPSEDALGHPHDDEGVSASKDETALQKLSQLLGTLGFPEESQGQDQKYSTEHMADMLDSILGALHKRISFAKSLESEQPSGQPVKSTEPQQRDKTANIKAVTISGFSLPPTQDVPETKRKPPTVLRSRTSHQKGSSESHQHTPAYQKPSTAFTLPASSFNFKGSGSLKLAGCNGVPPISFRPISRPHITPVDIFNLKRESLGVAYLGTVPPSVLINMRLHSRARKTVGPFSTADSNIQTSHAPSKHQFVDIHVPFVDGVDANSRLLPFIGGNPNLIRPPSQFSQSLNRQPTTAISPQKNMTKTKPRTGNQREPPRGPPSIAREGDPNSPSKQDAVQTTPSSHMESATVKTQTISLSTLQQQPEPNHSHSAVHESPNQMALERHRERKMIDQASKTVFHGTKGADEVKALLEEFSVMDHTASEQRHACLPEIGAKDLISVGDSNRRSKRRDVQETELRLKNSGKLYLSTHGDRSWRFTTLPNI
ncbi:hypothetical protein HDU78_008987 [Chytriomyces hyalinus]|nr:hypothetical protein HDU78_008987 [Chytriomyces hyalinus]